MFMNTFSLLDKWQNGKMTLSLVNDLAEMTYITLRYIRSDEEFKLFNR